MAQFAHHKLKKHYSQLMNSSGSYLCLYCEKSSPDVILINEHTKSCRRNQIEGNTQTNVTEQRVNLQEHEEESFNYNTNNASEEIDTNRNYNPSMSTQKCANHLLFTCL